LCIAVKKTDHDNQRGPEFNAIAHIATSKARLEPVCECIEQWLTRFTNLKLHDRAFGVAFVHIKIRIHVNDSDITDCVVVNNQLSALCGHSDTTQQNDAEASANALCKATNVFSSRSKTQ
jgi:hypothetical protein